MENKKKEGDGGFAKNVLVVGEGKIVISQGT